MRLSRLLPIAFVTTVCGFALAVGCSDDPVDGATTNGAGASAGTSAGGAGGAGGGMYTGTGGAPTHIAECQGHIYACGNLEDDDGDGLIDSQDADCLGPCDNTEDGYFGGIPGQIGQACIVDCYFDQDSGAGNDGCYWNHQCDEHETAANGYHPESYNGAACEYNPAANTPGTSGTCDELYQTQADACLDYCGPLTPNGCDCFGCCELPAGSGSYVWLGSDADGTKEGSCTMDLVNDPSRCEPCKPVAGCLNGCATCELCLGKLTLPDECYENDAGTPQQCEDGLQPCGLQGQAECPAGFYCTTGCCIEVPQ